MVTRNLDGFLGKNPPSLILFPNWIRGLVDGLKNADTLISPKVVGNILCYL